MSMLSSFSNAFQRTFNTVGAVAGAVEKSVTIGTTYIDQQAIRIKAVSKEQAILDTTLGLEAIQAELEGNAKRQALFDECAKLFA